MCHAWLVDVLRFEVYIPESVTHQLIMRDELSSKTILIFGIVQNW